jgi:hypothetical protein
MEYEGSIGLVTRKMFFLLILIFLELLWRNNMIWAIKKIPSVTRRPLPLQKFVSTIAQSLKDKEPKFLLPQSFAPT